MSYTVIEIGDADGDGHHLTIEHSEEGTVIINSENPDNGDLQRVVMLEKQWMDMFYYLLQRYGGKKCRLRDMQGNCILS